MKRIISLITALTMLLTLIVCNVPSAFAAKEELEFVLTNGAGLNNEEFTIELQLQNNPGIYAYYLMLYYDTDVFILRDYKLADEFAQIGSLITSDPNLQADDFKGSVGQRVINTFPAFGVDAEDKSMILLEYEIDDVTKNCELNGTSITLTFQVMGIAEPGDYNIGLIPDMESIINIDAEDVPFKMTNSIVSVGTTEAPAETAPTQSHKDTQKVEDTTDTTASDIIVLDPDDTTANNAPEVTKPAETFKGEDGKDYYKNEAGETVEYKEEDFETTPADPEDTTTAPDLSADGEEITGEDDGKNNTVLYIVIAAILVLVAVAGVLVVFISKTKKENTDEEKAEDKSEEE